MAEENLDEELTELTNLKVPEVSLVDKPAVGDATFMIFKRATEEGEGGTDYCYCDKCKIRIQHVRGKPCNEQKCSECGEPMTGVADNQTNYKEVLTMEDEKKPEDGGEVAEKKQPISLTEAMQKATEMIEECDATEEEVERKKSILDSLKGVKKVAEPVITEKAGRKVSKDTEIKIASIVDTLAKAVSELKSLYSKAGNEYIDEEEKEEKPAKKSVDAEFEEVTEEEVSNFFKAVQGGFIKEEEVSSITALLS